MLRGDPLPRENVGQQLAGTLRAFAVVDLPVDDLAAEPFDEQVEIELNAEHLGGQLIDVLAIDLIGTGGCQCARPAAPLRGTFGSAVPEWSGTAQQSVRHRFAGHEASLIGQARHDLARHQVLELVTVEQRQRGLSLGVAQSIQCRGDTSNARSHVAIVNCCRSLPALHGAFAQVDLCARRLQPGAGIAGLGEKDEPRSTFGDKTQVSSSFHSA